ncbi:hypothetical protein [Echinicola arenosa]|nr:hypothetical protein [Echinicola arenosa]
MPRKETGRNTQQEVFLGNRPKNICIKTVQSDRTVYEQFHK